MVGYLLGWLVGVAGFLSFGFWETHIMPLLPRPLLAALWLLILGLVSAGVGLAFTWSSGGWSKLKPGKFALRLLVRVIICDAAIWATWGLVFLVLAALAASNAN